MHLLSIGNRIKRSAFWKWSRQIYYRLHWKYQLWIRTICRISLLYSSRRRGRGSGVSKRCGRHTPSMDQCDSFVGGALVGLLGLMQFYCHDGHRYENSIKRRDRDTYFVGAAPWYVRMPFLVEGGLYGAIGAFFSWVIIVGLLLWLRTTILGFLGIIPFVSHVLVNPLSGIFLLAIISFLGLLGAIGFLLGVLGVW